MSEKMYEALEICLEALETGADPGSVVKLYPELENELLPLLETSRQAQLLAIREVPQAALQRGRARVLQHAAGMRAASAKSRRRRVMFTFPRLATSLAIALLVFFSGTELVRASNGALPGDNLYPVKRTWEDVRLLLVANPEIRQELESEFEQERIQEVDELLAEGRHETIAFAGVVTEQSEDLWVVSGVTVQITPESRLPAVPVTVGASVKLQGRTNALGFVEADYVEILGWNIVLPTSVPTQIETEKDNSNSSSERNLNDRGDESEASADDGFDHRDRENNYDENEGDQSDSSREEDGSDKEKSEDDKNENGKRDGGDDENRDKKDD